MERVAPRQILYENQLPLAIESKSQRRLFFPEGGSTYGPTGSGTNPNIIRIPINADSLLDVQHSYLQFKLNSTTDAAASLAPDFGTPFIRRLRIESGGTTLEDIEEYGKLYGGVLFPAQASNGAVQDHTLTSSGIGGSNNVLSDVTEDACGAATGMVKVVNADIVNGAGSDGTDASTIHTKVDNAIGTLRTAVTNQNAAIVAKINAMTVTGTQSAGSVKHNSSKANDTGSNAIVGGTSKYYNVSLVSALLNMEKYIPLVMMNAGLTLELELDVAGSVGLQVNNGATTAGNGDETPEWTISDVRYVAHLIDLQRDFYDRMRMVMEGSGGVLQLAGTTFRHYQTQSLASATASATVNIPARIKSIKSVFFTMTPSTSKAEVNEYGVCDSIPNGIKSYQFRVGSVVYPPTAVQVTQNSANGYVNRGEAYNELRKAFGTLGDYQHGGVLLNRNTYLTATDTAVCSDCNGYKDPVCNPFALDFESFAKVLLENGINTADRSLNMTLEIERAQGPAVACNVDAWVMCDAIFYINLDGSVSVSI